MEFNIAVIKGDGIGPSVVDQALLTLDRVGEIYGHKFNYTEVLAGGCAIDATGRPLPQETIDVCKNSDAVLLGARRRSEMGRTAQRQSSGESASRTEKRTGSVC